MTTENQTEKEIKFESVTLNGEQYFKISNSDQMRPFFMSIVSDSNHWMFISSNGGLSAGRKDRDNALFPYYTDDKITEMYDTTGSKTIFRVIDNGQALIWEPFSERFSHAYTYSRNLYKSVYGNKVIFEETNHNLNLTFRYQWSSSNLYGFVKTSRLINNGSSAISIEVLDGLQNILPYGVKYDLQNASSNLVDAYKRSELERNSGLGIFALSAIIVDRAEPSEALMANTVWSSGVSDPTYLLSSQQLSKFRAGDNVAQEEDVKAERGAYFVNTNLTLAANASEEWLFVANINQGPSDVVQTVANLKDKDTLVADLKADVLLGTQRLKGLVATADGFQLTADKRYNARHFSNVMFNIMRGGVFDNNYQIEKWDFEKYLANANHKLAAQFQAELQQLPENFSASMLWQLAKETNSDAFKRLAFEYMPLKFSRRHGDPSRPWNRFSINTRSEIDGSKILDYEGNWRDIFQNWEALAHAYPEFIESMIHKFLNASTFDGYNPYRVTKGGFDWEIIEEHDPWSYIGYWGDHQIIYLLKFLEFCEQHYPGKLQQLFGEHIFVYANVPYKIKPYHEILKNPKDTIAFDITLDEKIRARRAEIGADGGLLTDTQNQIHTVNFIEKILATVLAKMSNFIPEGGIWLNTQRPEWNDANNALVGNGVSMVTLYYLTRFLNFFEGVFSKTTQESFKISKELYTFFEGVKATLENHKSILSGSISDTDRKLVMDGVGKAGSAYREQIYAKTFSGDKVELQLEEVKKFAKLSLAYLRHSIDANKRSDNMYHAYNLMTVTSESEVSISYLTEMLEGQVAVLSSGYLTSEQSLALLDGLKQSALFREDQYSYILYPNKRLPGFLEKNGIPADRVQSSKLLQQLVRDGNTQIIEQDVNGNYHFNGRFNNADSLKSALKELPKNYQSLVENEVSNVLATFEQVFNHKAFTGRSGTFYGYEGLGSIYWHMVSKLLLAVQECCLKAIEEAASDEIIGRLLEHFYEINEGIGAHKSPQLYGAFPTDPYSHTPGGKGAQQPGMTGQVKEDILSRIGELGVKVKAGKLTFQPALLRKYEFLQEEAAFQYIDVKGEVKEILLKKNALVFTYCQVPVVYKISENIGVEVTFEDGSKQQFEGLQLNEELTQQIHQRLGKIAKVSVALIPEICN